MATVAVAVRYPASALEPVDAAQAEAPPMTRTATTDPAAIAERVVCRCQRERTELRHLTSPKRPTRPARYQVGTRNHTPRWSRGCGY